MTIVESLYCTRQILVIGHCQGGNSPPSPGPPLLLISPIGLTPWAMDAVFAFSALVTSLRLLFVWAKNGFPKKPTSIVVLYHHSESSVGPDRVWVRGNSSWIRDSLDELRSCGCNLHNVEESKLNC